MPARRRSRRWLQTPGPVGQLLHRSQPPTDVGVRRVVQSGRLPDGDHGGAEVVGQGDGLATDIRVALTEEVAIQHVQPLSGAGRVPRQGGLLGRVAFALVLRKDLRVHEAVDQVAIELGVEPVQPLVDPCPFVQATGVAGRSGRVGQVSEDGRAFGQAETAMLQQRDQAIRIDGRIRGTHVLAAEDVDGFQVARDAAFGGEQHDGAAGR